MTPTPSPEALIQRLRHAADSGRGHDGLCWEAADALASSQEALAAKDDELAAEGFRKQALQDSIDGCAQRVQQLAEALRAAERARDKAEADVRMFIKHGTADAARAIVAEAALQAKEQEIAQLKLVLEAAAEYERREKP